MAIYRSSDHLARCSPDLYSNMFDVRRHPDIKHEPISATQPIHKDTIQISRDKLKEEALDRLRHTSKYVIAQNGFMRIGKYLFLAIAFPPYFVVYGLPKWILMEGLPAIFSLSLSMWKKVQHQAQTHLKPATQRIVQMVQFVQRLAEVLIQPIVHLALEIRQSIRRMWGKTVQSFKKEIYKRKAGISFPFIKLAEKLKYMQKRVSQIREKWSQRARTMTERVQEGIQRIKEAPQIFLGWSQLQFQRLSQQAVSFGVQWKNHFQHSHQLAERGTNWMYQQVKKGTQSLKNCFEPFANFYQQLQPHWQKVKNICRTKWQQTRDFFHQKHQKAFLQLKEKQEKLKLLSSLSFIHDLMTHPWMGKLPFRLQDLLKKWLSHRIMEIICERGIKIYSLFGCSFLQMMAYSLQALSQAMRMAFQLSHDGRNFVKVWTPKVLNVLRVGLRALRKYTLYLLYYFLLFIMMSSILFILGLRSLRNFMNLLTLHFSLKKKNN